MKIDLKNCHLLVLPKRNVDWDAVPGIIVKFGDGTFTWSIKDNINYEKDRGKLEDVRRGDQSPLDVSLTGKYEYIQLTTSFSGAAPRAPRTLFEAFDGVQSNGDPISWQDADVGEKEPWLDCAPYCVQLELHHDLRLECPETATPGEIYLFPFFRAEAFNADVKAGTIQMNGRCNVTDPLVKRIATDNWWYDVDESPTNYENWASA